MGFIYLTQFFPILLLFGYFCLAYAKYILPERSFDEKHMKHH